MGDSKVKNKVIVMDLEATCQDNEVFPNETTEIIEIGFCLYDIVSKEISDKTSIIIRPDVTKISEYCTELTGLTQEQVDKGISLAEASIILIEKWKSHKRIVATWGNDVIFVTDECNRKGLISPFWLGKSLNLHHAYKIKTGQKKKTGLSKALEYYNLEFEGIKHSGMWDAYNTAKVMKEMFK